jgi:hypothetical protein
MGEGTILITKSIKWGCEDTDRGFRWMPVQMPTRWQIILQFGTNLILFLYVDWTNIVKCTYRHIAQCITVRFCAWTGQIYCKNGNI